MLFVICEAMQTAVADRRIIKRHRMTYRTSFHTVKSFLYSFLWDSPLCETDPRGLFRLLLEVDDVAAFVPAVLRCEALERCVCRFAAEATERAD